MANETKTTEIGGSIVEVKQCALMYRYSGAERVEIDYYETPEWREDPGPSVIWQDARWWLENFMLVTPHGDLASQGWHGQHDDSNTSSVVIRIDDNSDTAIIARVF